MMSNGALQNQGWAKPDHRVISVKGKFNTEYKDNLKDEMGNSIHGFNKCGCDRCERISRAKSKIRH